MPVEADQHHDDERTQAIDPADEQRADNWNDTASASTDEVAMGTAQAPETARAPDAVPPAVGDVDDVTDTDDTGDSGSDEYDVTDRDGLMPGEAAVEEAAGLWPAGVADQLRDRLREVQLRFVDDPHAAAGEAAGLAEEAIDTLARTLAARRESLDDGRSEDGADTERLRVAVRRYRDLLDRLLDL